MSANFMNLHIQDGEPLGCDADYHAIAEYYTDQYVKAKSEITRLKEANRRLCEGAESENQRALLAEADRDRYRDALDIQGGALYYEQEG